jgi:cell division septation protein DedD
MTTPDWLSIQEISRLWGEETGHDTSSLQEDLEKWFAEFVKEPPTSRQLVPGVNFDTIIANRLLGMLGARYLERRTFKAYCEERGHSKPRFWFADGEAERDSAGPSLKESSSGNTNPQTNRQTLQQGTTRRKPRGQTILVAGLVVPLVALLLWGVETLIQLTAAQREIARLSAAVEASDSMIAKLRDELVIVRQAVESAQRTTSAETRDQLDPALASAIDAEKSAARAQAKMMHLLTENTRLTSEFTRTKVIFDFLDSWATKNPGQKQDAEVVETRPEVEGIFATAKISSDFLTSETPELVSQQIPQPAAFDNAQPDTAPPAPDSVTNWVQLGAFRNPDNASTVWLKLRRTQSDLLSDLHHKIRRIGREGRGTIHLLQVGPLMNATDAKTLCHNLAERNVECLAIRRIP